MKQGFIGFGNLAKAVYRGIRETERQELSNGVEDSKERIETSCLQEKMQFAYFSRSNKEVALTFYERMGDLVAFADVIWLMVKPQDLGGVLEQLKTCHIEGKTIVSPVAGKTIAYIERFLGKEQHVIRIMPNLAMAYRKSVTAFATNQPGSSEAVEIYSLLGKLGKVVELEESGFDLFTSVFGSGPAFILAFIQIFKEKMQEFNLPGSVLDELLLGLMQGTTDYFAHNQQQYSIEELIQNVTSKGGTTQAGLEYFRTHEIGNHFEGVLDAARKRSEEMSRNGND